MEIFSLYGSVKTVEMPPDRGHSHLHRGFAYIEFNTSDEAENAMKHMDGGCGSPLGLSSNKQNKNSLLGYLQKGSQKKFTARHPI